MLSYRSRTDSPSRARSLTRRGRRGMLTISWMIVGLMIVVALIVLWMMPISPRVNVFDWLSATFGFSELSRGSFFGLLIMPQRFVTLLPAALALLSMAALGASLQLYRRRDAVLVLGHLASAVRLQVPLPQYLRTAASGERPRVGRRLRRMAGELSDGRTVGLSLARAAGELPPLVLDRIAAAERSFGLGEALGPLLERERRLAATPDPWAMTRTYALIVITLLLYVTTMIMIFVMPKFAQIFADFKVKMPAPTRALVSFVRGFFPTSLGDLPGYVMLAVLILSLVALARLLARVTRSLFVSQQRPRWAWVALPMDWLVWHTPVWGRMTRDRHAAAACEALAEALAAGRPLPEAISAATMPSLNTVLRRRMNDWQHNVSAGQAAATAARAANLPALWCDLLAGAHADVAGAIAFAGRAYAAAWQRRRAVVSAAAPVLVSLTLAVAVGWVALALFTPLITLIDALSPHWSGT